MMEDKKLFIAGFSAMTLISIAQLLDPLIIAHVIDVSVSAGDIRDMAIWGLMFVGVVVLSGILSYTQTILLARLGVKIITRVKREVFIHMLKLPVAYFDEHPVGKLIARVESDAERVKQLFSSFSIMILGNILFFFGMILVLFFKNWQVTLFIVMPMPLIFIMVFFMLRYLSGIYRKIRRVYADLSGILAEYIQGIHIIQMFNREITVMNIMKNKSAQKRRMETKAAFLEYGFWGFYGFIIETLFIVMVILLITPKIFAGMMTVGALIIYIQYGRRIFEPLMWISEMLTQMQRAFVSLQRIFEILDTQAEPQDEGAESLVFNESIEFRDVWFKYKQDEWVLKGINLKINKGEKVALVGASGSGKTTTVSLLERFYDIDKGDILVDGKSIYNYSLRQIREKIGLVLQDIYLFPGNILENVRIYNDNIGESEVNSALKTVNAETFISRKGMNAEIMERGQNISQGEKQLISFARAIAFSPEIVIMDEATSSVDAQTESRIQQGMEKMLENKTAVIVAHRLTSVIDVDRIYMFQDGNIIAEGNHAQLMDISPEYRKLVQLQFLTEEGK